MTNKRFLHMAVYGVINADIVGSTTRLAGDRRAFYFNELKGAFEDLRKSKRELGLIRAFDIYRGDSFQGATDKAEKSLKIVLLLRCWARMTKIKYTSSKTSRKKKTPANTLRFPDLRIAIGIGQVEVLQKKLSESDGEAFHRSGRLIDAMKKHSSNLAIDTPWADRNEELDVMISLLDAIVNRWSPLQAEVVYYSLQGYNQTQIAQFVKTSTSAVNQRLKTANWNAIEKLLTLFENIIIKKKG